MSPAPRLPFGTALALAQRALAAPLAAILDDERLGMPGWFTLNALGLYGPTPVDVLANLLATNGLDATGARAVVAGLERSGLVEVAGGTAVLTPAGSTRYAALRERIDLVTARIFARFDADRVETARGLLQEIADSGASGTA
jgi:hypothetical protein